MKQILLILFISFSVSSVISQEISLKEKALDEFKKEHYENAIKILEQAVIDTPDDAEIYYYLGFFNHYKAYDSRPLKGYDVSYSERIFEYFDKAIEINPNYGNAKYFYGAECSANAILAMQNNDIEKLKHYYLLAFKKGAYPNWLLEYGKNMLNSCDKDAILFTGGNADYDVCLYLQLYQNYRTDITIIPIGFIDRPWYVKFLKQGLEGGVKKIILNLSDNQIYDIHPFKWKETNINIPLSSEIKEKYQLNANYQMQWTIESDLFSNRDHSKIESEKASKRTYLSPQRAILLQIVESNYHKRPIYFSNVANPIFYGGLNKYFSNCGLVSELTPIITENTEFEIDVVKIENLLQKSNLKYFSTIKDNDIPRISSIVFTYYVSVIYLAKVYSIKGNKSKLKRLDKFYIDEFLIDFNEKFEKSYKMN